MVYYGVFLIYVCILPNKTCRVNVNNYWARYLYCHVHDNLGSPGTKNTTDKVKGFSFSIDLGSLETLQSSSFVIDLESIHYFPLM